MTYRQPEPLDRQHRVDGFGCGELALDDWLQRHARAAQASGSARVYVATLEDSETVIGYYALAAAEVAPDEATERLLKGQPRGRSVPAILLARLAVDQHHQGVGLGSGLLQDALLRCVDAADVIGARALLVHAKHERAKSWYANYGFEESPSDPLHLLLLLKDIRRFLAGSGAGTPS